MTNWSKDELRKIAEADDLHISPFREDGMTYGTPTWIWSVAVDDALSQHLEVHMEIKRSGSQPSSKGPADWFTGTVRIDPLFQAHAPARAAGASVTFEPGAGRRGTPTRWGRP